MTQKDKFPYSDIGYRMKQFRVSLGLSQVDLYAGVVGTQPQMSRYERGERQPTVEVLRLLRERGADLNYIITGS